MHANVLKYFVEVVRCGSVRKASENLFVAASAINRQILKLEEELEVELFDRLPYGMRLNVAGERLLKHVQETLHGYHVTRADLHALKGKHVGHVKIAAMDSLFEDFLPAAVEEFSEIFPAVTYTLASVGPMDVSNMVLSGEADAGLTFVGRLPRGVRTVALAPLPLGVMMSPGHPLAAKEAISLADCVGQPFLRTLGPPPITPSMCPEFGQFWEQMEFTVICNWTPMVKRLILAGRGISFFSKIAFIEELARGEVVWRPFDLPVLRNLQVGIVVPNQRELSGVTLNFVGRMASRLKQMSVAATSV